ncbi:MAG: argininosuccinate lyase [Oscillospiraceae bacterium]|jgi:argininosuccinate lyase|nr:argininosuccinate lyase [Oscillospiraceae bacterium]
MADARKNNAKLWGGRFQKATDGLVDDFHSSIAFDQRLCRQDIAGSIAHATMLGEQGIIPRADAEKITAGLREILADIEAGRVTFDVGAEDIHMNVETLLTHRIGEAAGRLHTARSRNDQVALDARMYVKDIADEAVALLAALCGALLDLAEAHLDTVMPGYTHLQKAQPISLAHHLMAYFQMFTRDTERMLACHRAADVMPLGAGALAGTTYPIDRQRVADLLGFAAIASNSLDAVSDRDFMLDYLAAAAVCMMHLSRLCEELILWASDEFRFVEMDDAFATGSSIMPQKKNPDVAELIRGKTGRVYGDLLALLTVMKGLPLAYNKDMQEDKEALFDARDTLVKALTVFTSMLASLRFRKDVMARGAAGGFTNATDAADYLVKRGLPFRQAHEVIGRLVLHCLAQGKTLLDLSLTELQGFSPLFGPDVFEALAIHTCVAQRALPGGPAPQTVAQAIRAGRAWLANRIPS